MTITQILIDIHTLLSLIAIAAGVPAVRDLLLSRTDTVWTMLFLATAFATSATGFILPLSGVTPAVVVGIVALAVLGGVFLAKSKLDRSRLWRAVYAGGIVASLYLLVFVAIAQAFTKVPALQALAPTLSEPPFAIAQVAALAGFAALGLVAIRRFAAPVLRAS